MLCIYIIINIPINITCYITIKQMLYNKHSIKRRK